MDRTDGWMIGWMDRCTVGWMDRNRTDDCSLKKLFSRSFFNSDFFVLVIHFFFSLSLSM